MTGCKLYRKKQAQWMREYVPGESLAGISVSVEDVPEAGGMIAVNPDNPADQWYVAKAFFEKNYELIGYKDEPKAMPFGHAIEVARKGHKIARAGWNGKGLFLFISCPDSKDVPAENIWSEHGKQLAEANCGSVTVRPYMLIKSVDGSIVPWNASQTDMLADDWMIVD